MQGWHGARGCPGSAPTAQRLAGGCSGAPRAARHVRRHPCLQHASICRTCCPQHPWGSLHVRIAGCVRPPLSSFPFSQPNPDTHQALLSSLLPIPVLSLPLRFPRVSPPSTFAPSTPFRCPRTPRPALHPSYALIPFQTEWPVKYVRVRFSKNGGVGANGLPGRGLGVPKMGGSSAGQEGEAG